ncbi:MAG: PilN family type IVB pilus formation outer membrane protein [Propionivibrio sp.]|nr:PilN family type IVB pilus formation outer membrane protein [Propionivibrio sp.]
MSKRMLAIAAVVALAGCSTAMISPIKNEVIAQDAEAARMMKQAQRAPGSMPVQPKTSSVEHVDGIWLPVSKVSDIAAQSSAKDAAKRRISVNREFRTIQEVAERVTLLTGIPVIVSPDTAPQAVQQAGVVGAAGTVPTPGVAIQAGGANAVTPGLPPLPGVTSGNYAVSSNVYGGYGSYGQVPLSYDGPLSGFLDVAAARFGVSWEWTGDSIRMFRYTTKTFRIVALPGDTALQSTISNQTGGSGGSTSTSGTSGSGNGSSTASSNLTGVSFSGLSVWNAINDSIKGMLSPAGKVTVTAATGTVTVTDTPQIVSQVEKFVDGQNASLGKQVVVNVRVLSVDLNDSDEYGINWNLVYNSLSGNFGWTFNTAFAPTTGANSLALKILSTAGSASNSDIKAWQGSQSIISALSTQGHVSQITSASLTTLNNQPAPLQVGRQTSYLASSTTTVTQGAGSTTTLQPGLITTGFSMSLVPHMLDKGKLMLQYAIDISSLLNLSQVTSGGSTIQTPDIDTRNFLQRVMLNSGDTLVMSGFEQSTLNATSQGMGDAGNVALGGGVRGKKARSVLVILIQPVVADL